VVYTQGVYSGVSLLGVYPGCVQWCMPPYVCTRVGYGGYALPMCVPGGVWWVCPPYVCTRVGMVGMPPCMHHGGYGGYTPPCICLPTIPWVYPPSYPAAGIMSVYAAGMPVAGRWSPGLSPEINIEKEASLEPQDPKSVNS